ncbi:MAG TPA: DNA polymerase III subunit delta', partial [Candidatus Latescibacteria bacterium]|nr:DNA polymerase III subunit delta' [Candidatus Latescibacterota bacterium]
MCGAGNNPITREGWCGRGTITPEMSFDNVIGQEWPKEALKRALKTGRLAHAILLHGPEGIGKRALALELAKAVNCTGSEADPCDTCRACRRISAGLFPDLKVLFPVPAGLSSEKETSLVQQITGDSYREIEFGRNVGIPIERVRDLQRYAAYHPYEGRRKVSIILEADQMRPEAANALLKTLEEPPHYLLLVLTARNPDALLPTILSRCQLLRLRSLTAAEIEEALIKREGLEPKKARLIARVSDGSLSKAQRLLGEDIDEYRDKAYEFLKIALQGDDLARVNFIEDITGPGQNRLVERLLNTLLLWMRDILLWQEGHQNEVVNFDRPDQIKEMAQAFNIRSIEETTKIIQNCLEMMSRNVNAQLILFWLVGRLQSTEV